LEKAESAKRKKELLAKVAETRVQTMP